MYFFIIKICSYKSSKCLINKGENTRTKKCFIKKICKRYVLHMENENINIYIIILFIIILY